MPVVPSQRSPADHESVWDVAIVGGGPVGLAAAIEARRAGLAAIVIEKGPLVASIFGWPADTTFFSEAGGIEIGGHPLVTRGGGAKPSREEALIYYRKVATAERLHVRLYTAVTQIAHHPGSDVPFTLATRDTHPARSAEPVAQAPAPIRAKHVLLATGYFDRPNQLDVPGADLPHVQPRVEEPSRYWGQRVVIIGGSNSAIESALALYRAGADVTVVARATKPRETVKYWLAPDFRNRVAEGSIRLVAPAVVVRITPRTVEVEVTGTGAEDVLGSTSIEANWVLPLIGYRAVDGLLRDLPIAWTDHGTPALDRANATTVPGLYVVGSAGHGRDTRAVFIENGRAHAASAIRAISSRRPAGRSGPAAG